MTPYSATYQGQPVTVLAVLWTAPAKAMIQYASGHGEWVALGEITT